MPPPALCHWCSAQSVYAISDACLLESGDARGSAPWLDQSPASRSLVHTSERESEGDRTP